MLLIQELQNREYPFKKLPQDLVDAVIGVLTIPENQVYNSEQKISVLDQTIFYSIASLHPNDKDIIELKAFIEEKESKENNDGFNTNLTDTLEPVEYNVQQVIDNAEYQKRHKNNQLLRLSIEKMLNAQKKGNGFDVERGKNEIGNRIDKAKIFLESKPFQLEPSVVYLYEGKLSFEDGRHRLIAAQELGATHAYFEVPKDQVSEFNKIAGETNDNQQITCEKCGWEWNTVDSEESDKYVCHKCDHDNSEKYEEGGALDLRENAAERVKIELAKIGININYTTSNTGYGTSHYFTEYNKNGKLFKIRISDHEATNPVRTTNELMIKESDVENDIQKIVKRIELYLRPERFRFVEKKIKEGGTHIVDGKQGAYERIEIAKTTDIHVGDTNSEKYEKGGLIAPNGKKSNLTTEQYKLVRTPEFKVWFGDWEKYPPKASKVVDENGEPRIVYHGTKKKFNVFKFTQKRDIGFLGAGFYFTNSKKMAQMYAQYNFVYEVFLNIKNPLIVKELKSKQTKNDSDGIIYYSEEPLTFNKEELYFEYVTFNSSQIKLADGSNTTFDAGNPDIRYEDGGQMKSSNINSVRDLANLDAEHEGILSGAVFSVLKKGDVLSVAGKTYTVTTLTKPTESSYYSKKDNKKVDYKKSTIRLIDEKGVTISGEFWEYKNGSGIWSGKGQTRKSDRWNNLSRDIEGDITLDLINENNEFHGLSDSYKKAQAFIDNYNNMNRKLDKGGNLGVHTGTDQIEVFVVTSDREPLGVFKTLKEAKKVKPSTSGHQVAIHPIEVPVKDWNAGAVTDNAKYYLRKFMLNNYFKKGGTVEFQETNINDDLEAFDLNNLDPLETRFYSDFFKSTNSKVQSLQVLINMVEGDYTQLNEELAILAEKQIPSAQWDKWSQEETYAGGGQIIGDKRAQDIVKYLVKEIRAKTPNAEIPNLEKFIKEGPTKEVLLPAYQEFRFYVNNGNNKDSIRCAYDDSVRFYEYVISFIPNKTQREMFKHYGESQIKELFPNYKSGGVAGKAPIEPDYNRSVQSEVEDFLDTFDVGESLIDERPADLASYNSGINWVNLSNAMEPLFDKFNQEQVNQAANGLISDGYLSPNFTMLGGYLKRMNENRETSNMESGGSIVKHYGRDIEHRLGRPSGSIEKEILEKVSGRINSEDFVGNFGWKTPTGKLGDGYLYKLDDFDANLVKAIKLKPGEHIFRYVNRLSAIGGMMPFIKINIEKGLLYWLKDSEDDEIHFETLGRKALWVGLIENKYESGGNIYRETVFTKEINRGITITVKKYPNGQIVEIENKHNVHFPFKVGQILNRNAEVWASNNGYLMDGKDVGPEEKIFGIRVKDIPDGHEFRMLYPHKFRKHEEGGEITDEEWLNQMTPRQKEIALRRDATNALLN